MKLGKWLGELNKKVAWSFIGVIFALVFGILSVYSIFFQEKRTSLGFDVLSNTSVLDVREEIGKLEILYDGNDISKKDQSLRVITFRVINNGDKDILKGFYDDNAPLGFKVTNGEIIKFEILDSSNEYLEENLNLKFVRDSEIEFSSVIIEVNEYFTVKVLVLHEKINLPDIIPKGKVAGVKRINVKELYKEQEGEPFFKRSLGGGFFVQVIRILVYFGGLIFFLILIIYLGDSISENFQRWKRRKVVNDFKNETIITLNNEDVELLRWYIDQDIEILGELVLLFRKKSIKDYVFDNLKEGTAIAEEQMLSSDALIPYHFLAKRALEAGFIKKSSDGYKIDQHIQDTLREFLRFLKNRKLLTKTTFFNDETYEFIEKWL